MTDGVTIRDRKINKSDGASLYSLCRSWLRNGSPEHWQRQLQYGDVIQPPVPLFFPKFRSSPKSTPSSEETESDEDVVENLHAKELLRRHVKRAKRVRARLREERRLRIEGGTGRLALLLGGGQLPPGPPPAEQGYDPVPKSDLLCMIESLNHKGLC